MLGLFDLKIVGMQANRCATARSTNSIANRAVQVELERVAVLVRLRVVRALVTLTDVAGLVLAELVLREFGKKLPKGVRANLTEAFSASSQAGLPSVQ